MRPPSLAGHALALLGVGAIAVGPLAAPAGAAEDDLSVTTFMVFVPAKDFALSKRFYRALGSELVDDGADYAEFRWGDYRFIVSDEYQAQWAENFKVHVIVKDAAAFARRASQLAASGDFPGVTVEGPKEEPWGYKVTYVRDPSGVSLRFSEPNKK